MKKFIKLLLIILLAIIALWNYKIISFNGGFKFINTNNQDIPIEEQIKELTNIEGIYYYKNPFNSEEYVVVLETKDKLYLDNCNEDELKVLEISGAIIKNIKPQAISIFPWWGYGIIFLVILVLPTKKRK